MIIHIVRTGDTLQSISIQYNVPTEVIIRNNGLEPLPNLILGQSLLIPGGENPPKIPAEINGYIVPSNDIMDQNIVNNVAPYLTYITPSNYTVNSDGTINELRDEAILKASYGRIAPLMSISNLSETDFDPEIAHQIFINEEAQQNLLNETLNILQRKSYYGLNINFERLYPEDRQLYNQFIAKAVDFFHQYNYPVSTALVPKTYDDTTGEWWGAHDYLTQGRLVDFVILMTYDWGCVSCSPMAIAPINEVRRVLDYAVTVIPSYKILMGIPLYGFDWKLPFEMGERATLIDYSRALELASTYGASIQFDPQAQAPYFYYFDRDNREHIVWFEDARSFRAKFGLVRLYNLRGISYWSLELSAPQNWVLLENTFDVVKIT